MPIKSTAKKLLVLKKWKNKSNFPKLRKIIELFNGQKTAPSLYIFNNMGERKAEQLAKLLNEIIYFNIYNIQGFTSNLKETKEVN